MTNTDCSISEQLEESRTMLSQSSAQQLSPLLPKESEYIERKRPLAIQELLEKKKARLAHQVLPKITANVDMGTELQPIFNKLDESYIDKNKANELKEDTLFYCDTNRDDNETASCSSGGECSFSWASLSHTLPLYQPQKRPKSSNKKLNFDISSPLSSYASLVNSPTKNFDFLQNSGEIGENALAKSVPCDRIFAQVPGRLSLLSNVIKYKMTVGEVKRRLMGPESFNFSLLGALLRRAKMPEKSQMLVEELNQVGLSIPRGRRRLSQITLLSALTEAESLQLVSDFRKICEAEFPAKLMALEALSSFSKIKTTDITRVSELNNSIGDGKNNNSIRLQKLTSAIRLTNQFLELLSSDRSLSAENNIGPLQITSELQAPLSTFSMLTHGFGNPAIQVGVTCFLRFLERQMEILYEQQEQVLSKVK